METTITKPIKKSLAERRRKHWEMLNKLSDAEFIKETKHRLKKLEQTFIKYSGR